MILVKNHVWSGLIAQAAHWRVQHNGVKKTLTEMQAKFWVVGGRSLVHLLIRKCVICRRYEGTHLPSLPETKLHLPLGEPQIFTGLSAGDQ